MDSRVLFCIFLILYGAASPVADVLNVRQDVCVLEHAASVSDAIPPFNTLADVDTCGPLHRMRSIGLILSGFYAVLCTELTGAHNCIQCRGNQDCSSEICLNPGSVESKCAPPCETARDPSKPVCTGSQALALASGDGALAFKTRKGAIPFVKLDPAPTIRLQNKQLWVPGYQDMKRE
ncbi:hypothetical protein DFH07DRAFT_768231 [Mycena maculata]|uniref:Uncharacterized protein n=1 Tax=Mycena maculata TaxID=230809 RepID=A0AAD7NQ99_9AGAR|nr:hypothetical protein DFH07DRAFT_768231 [Mycena maculata]